MLPCSKKLPSFSPNTVLRPTSHPPHRRILFQVSTNLSRPLVTWCARAWRLGSGGMQLIRTEPCEGLATLGAESRSWQYTPSLAGSLKLRRHMCRCRGSAVATCVSPMLSASTSLLTPAETPRTASSASDGGGPTPSRRMAPPQLCPIHTIHASHTSQFSTTTKQLWTVRHTSRRNPPAASHWPQLSSHTVRSRCVAPCNILCHEAGYVKLA